MKVSIFENNIVYGVDYSKREDCTAVIDITDDDFASIGAGLKKINTDTLEVEDIIVEDIIVDDPIIEEENS